MTQSEERKKKIDAKRPQVKKHLRFDYAKESGDEHAGGKGDAKYIDRQDKSEVTYAIASFIVDFSIKLTKGNVEKLEDEVHSVVHQDSNGKTIRENVKKEVELCSAFYYET